MTRAGLNGKIWPLFVIGAIALVVAFWHWVLRADVVTYGDPTKTYFQPASATEGDQIEICFDDLVWYRLCRGRLITRLTPAKGSRMDLEAYTISTPAKVGRVPPKCRKWTVPALNSDREEGAAVLDGFAEFECWPIDHWSPIVMTMPPLKLNILKRKP